MKKVGVLLILLIISLPFSSASIVHSTSKETVEIEKVQEQESIQEKPTSVRTTSYYYGTGLIAKEENNEISYYHKDNLGSTRAVTDKDGNKKEEIDYLPYGEVLNSNSETFTFTGKEKDSSGLQYFGARYYDSSIGRFTTVDPIRDGINFYTYANNNPLKFVDPTGLVEQIPSINSQRITPFSVSGVTTDKLLNNAREIAQTIENMPDLSEYYADLVIASEISWMAWHDYGYSYKRLNSGEWNMPYLNSNREEYVPDLGDMLENDQTVCYEKAWFTAIALAQLPQLDNWDISLLAIDYSYNDAIVDQNGLIIGAETEEVVTKHMAVLLKFRDDASYPTPWYVVDGGYVYTLYKYTQMKLYQKENNRPVSEEEITLNEQEVSNDETGDGNAYYYRRVRVYPGRNF